MCPPTEYFASLLVGLVNNVIPPISSKSKFGANLDHSSNLSRAAPSKNQSGTAASDGRRTFYQNQDTGSYTQLVLETAVIEILSLPVPASQIVPCLFQLVVHIQPTLILSSSGHQGSSSMGSQNTVLPTSPSGGSTDSLGRQNTSSQGLNASHFMSRSGYSSQQLSSLLIQACGLLLSQLPMEFHLQLYSEASRLIKDCWWLSDGTRSHQEIDSAIGYSLVDPSWAAQDNTSTAIGNMVALLHAVFSNLPQEWLETTHLVIKNLRPLSSVATLRIIFRIIGPLFPRLSFVRPVFFKTVVQLIYCMNDIFGVNVQPPSPIEASEIVDLIDFLHHIVLCEGQGGPVQSSSKPKAETLTLFSKATESLRPDVQHLLTHLRSDPNSSIYAATHTKTAPNTT